ncbi:MAG: dihydrodipicolinate reductase [Deltaproteobacteria bacterium]|nr:dihydrodipicolinate reductase [Deltaproteobacteria bacterium]MBN2844376.1 dihydrodipicolinate reductase [Deltaproteobacteria bacterium]
MKTKKIRVVHYGLGPIGIETAKYVLKKSNMEIVGAVDISKDMIGKDLGKILDLSDDLGVVVTDNARQLLSNVKADVVIHTAGSRIKGIFSQLEEIIESGSNIVSSAEELLFPLDEKSDAVQKLTKKALEKGVTVLGTGVNPGFVMDALPLFLTAVCQDVHEIHVERIVDAGTRRYPLQKKIGAGMTPEVFRAKVEEKALGHVGIEESLMLVARNVGFSLDEVQVTIDPVFAVKPVKTDYFDLKEGDIAGIKNVATGISGGRTMVLLDLRMYIGAEDPHDSISIKGNPPVTVRIEGGVAGDQATAAILVNSTPAVVDAKPGLVTVKDLPSPNFRI